LGKRADTATLLDTTQKCIIEGSFDIRAFELQHFFEENDLDFEEDTRIRREITPQGKSRAFINETPVTLNLLKQFGEQVVDIHSQHNTLLIHHPEYQLELLDAFAENDKLLNTYFEHYTNYRKKQTLIEKIKKQLAQEQADNDYIQFLLEELEAAKVSVGEQTEIENELNILSHSEELKKGWYTTAEMLSAEDRGILNNLNEILQQLRPIQNVQPELEAIYARLHSAYIELDDIAREANAMEESVELDPKRQEYLDERLALILKLVKKHQLQHADELQAKEEELVNQISLGDKLESQLQTLQTELKEEEKITRKFAEELTKKRHDSSLILAQNISSQLAQLGIPEAEIQFRFNALPDFTETGLDELEFLFSANAGLAPDLVSKTASGGELSRLMLSIKYLLTTKKKLPTIIFDEIDSGVSGEVAERLGKLMQQLSKNMQVLSITHLPQIAALAPNHYLVYKKNETTFARTGIKKLSDDERIDELAAMLSGSEISQSARENARVLLRK